MGSAEGERVRIKSRNKVERRKREVTKPKASVEKVKSRIQGERAKNQITKPRASAQKQNHKAKGRRVNKNCEAKDQRVKAKLRK